MRPSASSTVARALTLRQRPGPYNFRSRLKSLMPVPTAMFSITVTLPMMRRTGINLAHLRS
jgi:hypothetical protein